jgi:hypothetical protein
MEIEGALHKFKAGDQVKQDFEDISLYNLIGRVGFQ